MKFARVGKYFMNKKKRASVELERSEKEYSFHIYT